MIDLYEVFFKDWLSNFDKSEFIKVRAIKNLSEIQNKLDMYLCKDCKNYFKIIDDHTYLSASLALYNSDQVLYLCGDYPFQFSLDKHGDFSVICYECLSKSWKKI